MTPAVDRLVVIGVGLIGGSFALDLKQNGLVREVIGVGRSASNLALAQSLGVVDRCSDQIASAVASADMVMLAVPVGSMHAALTEIAPVLPARCIVTDVGSTKQDVIAAARAALGDKIGQFVPGHPIAGAETSGAAAARVGLFAGKPLILTPLPENASEQVERVAALWAACGADVNLMTAPEHDAIFAAVSHLPHLAAFALMDELVSRGSRTSEANQSAETYLRYAGAGFRDFTRIAASHPEMWRDISLANRDAVVAELDAYIKKLGEVRNLVAKDNGGELEALFSRAREARQNWNKNT
jgi:prephenate dehydrogenase